MTRHLLFVFLACLAHEFIISSAAPAPAQRDTPDPPPHEEVAKMARHLVHYSNYTSIATISTREGLEGTPFVNMVSMVDGVLGESSTGTPYFFMTDMAMSGHDMVSNPKMSIALSLAQGGYCRDNNLDPQDPRCARTILSGERVKLEKGSEEETNVRKMMFARHPAMSSWPESHGFYFCKLDVKNIIVLDWFGGAQTVTVEDYFNATYP